MIFDKAETWITFKAVGETSFVLGSAPAHPHDLIMGYYSVHSSAEALKRGEKNIQRIRTELRRAGKL